MSALENPSTQGSTLTDLETRILDFERNWWRFAGAKESAIKDQDFLFRHLDIWDFEGIVFHNH